jgi:hypothetical protein
MVLVNGGSFSRNPETKYRFDAGAELDKKLTMKGPKKFDPGGRTEYYGTKKKDNKESLNGNGKKQEEEIGSNNHDNKRPVLKSRSILRNALM